MLYALLLLPLIWLMGSVRAPIAQAGRHQKRNYIARLLVKRMRAGHDGKAGAASAHTDGMALLESDSARCK
jgi:hypothetical protein